MNDNYDVVVVGGGPAGLSAALALGRACRRVLLCDAGTRRNESADAVRNFVTRDGEPPNEFKSVAREQLDRYPNVELLGATVECVVSHGARWRVEVEGRVVETRRVLLCTGMVDQSLGVKGADELWGSGIFQCPYCHGWEHRGKRWGLLASNTDVVEFALILKQWTEDLTVFTHGRQVVNAEQTERLNQRNVAVDLRPIVEFVGDFGNGAPRLQFLQLADGTRFACDALFAHPKQSPVDLVVRLELTLDESGFVAVHPTTGETSQRGVYAAGDMITRRQAAIAAAASGSHVAAEINHSLALE